MVRMPAVAAASQSMETSFPLLVVVNCQQRTLVLYSAVWTWAIRFDHCLSCCCQSENAQASQCLCFWPDSF